MAQQQDFGSDKRRRLDDLPELPEGRPALLMSAVYSGDEKKVYLKLYDPKDNVIYHWRDRTDHKPYCYTKMEYAADAEQVAKKEPKYTLERAKKRDIILDKEIEVLKVLAPDPLSIGGTDSSFREKVTSWECYDIETEILTKERGWKNYYQLYEDEVVATYNQATHKFEWQQIEAKVDYDYNGEMYGLHAKTVDFLVTPNHRVFLWNDKGDARCILAKDLYHEQEQPRVRVRSFPSGWSIQKSAITGFDGDTAVDKFTLHQSSWRCSEVEVPIEEFSDFLGWFLAEGGIGGKGNETYINLVLSTTKDPWQRLKHMIESWGMKVWTKSNEDTHSTILIFSSKDLATWIRANCYNSAFHRSHYKRIPTSIKNLSTKYLKIFLKSLFLGDGTLRDGDSGQLKTASEALADDIQEIACKCGYSVSIKQKPAIVDSRGWQFADSYVVTLSTHRTATNPDQKITKQQYVGKVWCVKVPNGIVYVRRNKKPYWCGNSDIKYHENYLYDRALIPGAYYVRKGDQIKAFEYPISDKVQSALKSLLWDKIKEAGESGKENRQYITNWANLLNQPIPELRRIAIDIEVETEEGRMPNPREHDRRVTAVGCVGSDGFRKVLVLTDNTPTTGEPLIAEAEPCTTEKELLEKAFMIINQYPIVLTFNGDDFDLPYLYARSQDSRIDPGGIVIPKEKVPIMVKRDSFVKRGMQAEPVGIRHGIHIDLYRTFDNRSIQIYAFSRAYTEHTLNAISEAMLGDTKVEFDGDIADLPIQKLAEYCLKDADLTFRLTSFNDSLLMKLLVVIARIGRLSVDDIARFGVNQWIRGILYYEHRQRNELIPSRKELEEKGTASTTAVIKEKKYRGGEVVEPTPGIHFNVVVLDFASLYPSIIKVYNLSYETINCPHDSCKETRIEGTTHWVCKQRKGLASLLIGSLRDLRVNYYKSLAKDKTLPPDERQLYNVVSQATKVILNGAYGVMGADIFPLYCLPVADSIAAIGRTTIHKAIDKCKEIGIEVVYSDSVLPNTPIVIRRKDGSIDIVPIGCLVPKTHTPNRYDKFGKLDVLTESGFSRIKYVYKHKVKKKGYRILTRKGLVECTEDHSLVIDGREVTPAEVKVGDRVNQVPFRTESKIAINPDLAWLFGFFIAEGTCGAYHYNFETRDVVKYSWRIVNQNEEKLRRAQTIIQQCLGLATTIIDIRKSSATYALVPKGEPKILVDYFRAMCYRGSEKAIPRAVLNAHVEAKKVFIEGLIVGDGSMDRSGILTLEQIHKSVIAGIGSVLEELRIEYTVDVRSDKPNVCRLRVIRDKADRRILPADVIRKIETFDIDGYVYDLETENHHFCGGVGNILLHNTDSIFLKDPASTAVDEMANWARNTLGVDLEVDKEYRYVVFSDLKKNYLGVKPDGTVDVKGLTGKKSHTPPFIKNAFYDILAILGKVGTQKDFESAKESIKKVVQESAHNLEAHKIPLEELSFNVMINKSLGTYGKKDGKTMDGKDTYKGLPQHIKAAKMLEGKRELRAGDVISYVKIKTGEGVKPVELAKPEEIDTDKYLETMESTFEQVLSALNFDFKSVLGKPRQQSLDELFWSRPA